MSLYHRAKYRTDRSIDDLVDPVGTKKYDGAHYYMDIGLDGIPKFISRRESVHGGFPDKSDRIPHLTSTPMLPAAGNIYNVELIHTGMSKENIESHPAVSGILNSLPAKAVITQKITGPVRAVLLDVIHPKLGTYAEKLTELKRVEKLFNNPEVMFSVQPKIGKDEVNKLIESTKARGEEGVVITSLTTPEDENYRIKHKHLDTYNLKITKIIREVDKNSVPKDSMGAVEVSDATGRVVCNVGTGFSRALRRLVWEHQKEWLGKLIQVKAMPSVAEKLRSPVYNGEADGDLDTL